MTKIPTSGELPNQPAPIELWDRQTVLEFFGGTTKPLHISTLYRGLVTGIYPRPINTSGNTVRWLADECRAALQRMIAARNEPRKRPGHRGRPRGSKRAREAASAAEAER